MSNPFSNLLVFSSGNSQKNPQTLKNYGSPVVLAEYQRSRELHLFCQSCHEKWEQEIPKTYSVFRMACPHCKTETHGNILTLMPNRI